MAATATAPTVDDHRVSAADVADQANRKRRRGMGLVAAGLLGVAGVAAWALNGEPDGDTDVAAVTSDDTGSDDTGDTESTGDDATGDEKSGDEKSGDEKSGDEKSGDEKSGDDT